VRRDLVQTYNINDQKFDEDKKQLSNKKGNSKLTLNKFRSILNERGARGIIGLGKLFKISDTNNNNMLDYIEFKNICKKMKLLDKDLEESEIRDLFESFDNSRDGNINYDEFLRAVKGPMNQFRRTLVEKAFKKFDRNNNGQIDINDLKD